MAFNDCTSLQNIYVADGSLYFKSVDGVLFDKNGANLRYYPEGRTAESYHIPEGTIRVGGNAFAGNLFLKSVSYPTTLERIGTKAFFGCENLKDYYFNGMTAPLLETADLQVLAGLYDDLGMPADVIYLLVNHCITRSEERYGPGRRPTLRQIEKEGYYWARQGLFDQDSAARYLKTWRDRQQGQSAYMQVLGLGQRRPVASEEKYISDWMDKGFPPETVALAYDKTIFYKKQLEWRYLNGILRRWHENGWHTPEEVQQGDAGKPAQPSPKPDKPDQDNSRMEKYMKW